MSKSNCSVMWTSVYENKKHQWKKLIILSNLFLLILCFLLYNGWVRESNKEKEINSLATQLKNYKVKNEILNILRIKGITLGQGLDIADSLMSQCRQKNIPVELGLAIMTQESEFYTVALSSKKAKGLMQLLQSTFDNYNHNLKLGLPQSAIWDPIVNIKISVYHLSDLIDENQSRSKSPDELWKRVLIAYSGDAKGYPEAVRRIQKGYELKFRDGEI